MPTSRETLSRGPGLDLGVDRGARPAARAAAQAARPAGPALIVTGPGGERVTVAIPRGWSKIGSSPTAELQLEHPTVSRRHAVIVRDRSDALQIIDDRSLTGTYVNGARVSWSELRDGDELAIGGVRVKVACAGPRSAPLA